MTYTLLIYRGSTNERLSGEGVAYDSYYNETDCVNVYIQNAEKLQVLHRYQAFCVSSLLV